MTQMVEVLVSTGPIPTEHGYRAYGCCYILAHESQVRDDARMVLPFCGVTTELRLVCRSRHTGALWVVESRILFELVGGADLELFAKIYILQGSNGSFRRVEKREYHEAWKAHISSCLPHPETVPTIPSPAQERTDAYGRIRGMFKLFLRAFQTQPA